MVRLSLLSLLLASAAAAQETCPIRGMPLGPPEPVEIGLRVTALASGDVLLDGAPADSAAIDLAVRAHVRSATDTAIAFESERDLSYALYVRTLDIIKDAFVDERDRKFLPTFGRPFAELSCDERGKAATLVPFRILLTEP
ncbi:MAG: hypothetical protein AAFQ43_01490 [Bacteroidota bacterium]